jgi:hypothetical protein
MITQPNQWTLHENGVTYGLHTFRDGVNPTVICQLHASGEWITLGPPTEMQVKHFAACGVKAVPVLLEKKNGKGIVEPEPTGEPAVE